MPPRILVTLVQTTPLRCTALELSLPPGATVLDALQAGIGSTREGPVEQWTDHVGVFGQRCSLQRVLRDGDRVELYRSLAMDAKSARRLRAKTAPPPGGAAVARKDPQRG